MHPLEIKHRVDTAIDAAVREGATELRLCLALVHATIFASSLGLVDPPAVYRDVPVEVNAGAAGSHLAGAFPAQAAGKRWLL